MKFGNILIVSIIFSVVIYHNATISIGYQETRSNLRQDFVADLVKKRSNFCQQQFKNRIFSPHIHLRRNKKADRRLFFSFNQLLLSLVAPRLMRYQLDLMMHSMISELFHKIFVPVIGTSIKSAQSERSIFSSLSNWFHNHHHPQQQNQNFASKIVANNPTTAAPNLDLQRLLDNAQKLIALQTLIRNGQINNNKPGGHELTASNKEPMIPVSNKDSAATISSINIYDNNKQQPKTSEQQSNTVRENESQSKSNMKIDQRPIHFAILPKDFIDFLRNNWKLNIPINNLYNNNNTSGRIEKNVFSIRKVPKWLPVDDSNDVHSISDDIGSNNSGDVINKIKSSSNSKGRKNKFNLYKQKAKIEDFKMSHFTYIDTEVPNYGNQLLIDDPDDHNNDNMDNENNKESEDTMMHHLSTTADISGKYFLNIPSENSMKSNDDFERANRWNNVLSNMKRFG